MKTFLPVLALSLSLTTALPAAELLINGNFEGPTLTSDGNHLGSVPTSWLIANTTNPTTANDGLSNHFRGTVTSGTGVTSSAQYLGPCPYDTTSGAQQSLDGNGQNVVVSQTFTPTVTLNTPVEIKISFGGRDSGSAASTGSSWQLVNTATNAVLASATGFRPATGSWLLSDVVTGTLVFTANTTYRLQVTLDNTQHMDAASITTVPEPSSLAAAGALLLAGAVVRSVRSRRRSA